MQLAAFGLLPVHAQAWQLLYRTTGATGMPTTTVTTILRPASGVPRGLVSYQVAEDASGPECAPSYELRMGGGEPLGSVLNQAEIVMIDAAMADGHAISIPDWEGPTGSLSAPNAGYMALDGIRAAEHFRPLGLSGAATPVVAWGYSGGGYATAWTAQLQPTYAPKVRLIGAAMGGPVTDVAHTFTALNGGAFAGFYPSILPGLLRGNAVLRRAFDRYLTPAGKRLVAGGDGHCLTTNLALHAGLNMDQYLTIPLVALMRQPAVAAAFKHLSPAGRPRTSLFVYQAVHDELVFDADTTREVQRWCRLGVSVDYLQDEASEHGILMFAGGPIALAWINSRLAGESTPHGCVSQTVLSTSLTPAGAGAIPGYLLGNFGSLVGP